MSGQPSTRFAATLLAALLTLATTAGAQAQDANASDPPLVLTATQATWSIANALLADTPVEVVNVPEDGREFAVLRSYIERRKARLAPIFASATAVVALTNALPADPLFRYARAVNVRAVNIDAALPVTYDTPGVALTDMPHSNVAWYERSEPGAAESTVAPYFWLSLSNTMRMADIVAGDLARLFPAYATTIESNADRFRQTMLDTRNDFQSRLLEAGDDTVFALTGDFVYLTNDLGLFVDGYFIQQDIRWTDTNLSDLTAHLRSRDIRVVIHKWMPNDAIQAAVSAAGAQLVVLETGDPGRADGDMLAVDGLQRLLVDNLEKITTALQR